MRAPARPLPKQSFAAHVAELRGRLFATFAVLLVGAGVGYLLRQQLLDLLIAPLHQPLYYTSPGGGFNFVLQLCLVFGALWAIPVLIFHTLRFVAPILPPHTNRFIAGSLIASCALMATGIAFAYLVSLPAALHFLNEFSTDQVSALISTDTYLSFVTTYLAAFALLFQLPLVLLIINKLTPLPPKTLLKQTKWVVLVSFIVSAIVTPTQDPVNQTIMAGPLIGLFLASCGLIWLVDRRRDVRRGDHATTREIEVDVLANLRERLLDLEHAKLVAQQYSMAEDGRTGFLCEWEERRWGKLRRRIVTFQHKGRHELIRLERR